VEKGKPTKPTVEGQIELVKEVVKVQHVLGEVTRQVTLRSEVSFPVEARKVKDVLAEVTNIETQILDSKILIEGTLHKQIGWVADIEGPDAEGITYEVGGVYDLPVNEEFSEYVDMRGITPGAVVTVEARVEYVDHDELSAGVADIPDRWRQTVILELYVKAVETVEMEIVTDVIAPAGMEITVCKDTFNVEAVLGDAERQENILIDYDFPEGVQVVKVKDVHSTIRGVTSEVLPNKVIVQGTLHSQVYYVEETTRRLYETSVDQQFTTYVDLPGVSPETDVSVNVRIEYLDVDFREGTNGAPDRFRVTAILQIFVRATEDRRIEIVTDVIGPNLNVTRDTLVVACVIGHGERQEKVHDTRILFDLPVKKIADIDARVDINRHETKVLPNKVVIEGLLHKQVYWVDLCEQAVWETSIDETFRSFVDIKGTRPGMTVQVHGSVEGVDISGPHPDYPEDLCEEIELGNIIFDPTRYPWQQNAFIRLRAKVTESVEVPVVTNVTVGGAVPPPKPEPEPDTCPDYCPEEDHGEYDHQPSMRYYTIRRGDTLYLIAKRYGTTVEALMALNPGINPQNLQIGQKIRIS